VNAKVGLHLSEVLRATALRGSSASKEMPGRTQLATEQILGNMHAHVPGTAALKGNRLRCQCGTFP
jgi:hypothetical protein